MYVPAVAALHDIVAVPDDVMLIGDIAPQVRPVEGVSVRLTVPVKPFDAVTVIVEMADCPAFTAAGEDATIVKSTKLNVAVAVCTSDPLVPVTVNA